MEKRRQLELNLDETKVLLVLLGKAYMMVLARDALLPASSVMLAVTLFGEHQIYNCCPCTSDFQARQVQCTLILKMV